jgi:hypothetical protein
MATIRPEQVSAAINRAYALTDYRIQNTLDKQHEFKCKIILSDKSLTNYERSDAINKLEKFYDYYKIIYNQGKKRICENCQNKCLAITYCEYCVRNYLKDNFSNWTSGNDSIDNLLQKCQLETISPEKVIEWIPYDNLQNIEYLTKGGFSKIYTAEWIEGECYEWDSKEKKIIRFGKQKVILKTLENVQNANRSWIDEVFILKKIFYFMSYFF